MPKNPRGDTFDADAAIQALRDSYPTFKERLLAALLEEEREAIAESDDVARLEAQSITVPKEFPDDDRPPEFPAVSELGRYFRAFRELEEHREEMAEELAEVEKEVDQDVQEVG